MTPFPVDPLDPADPLDPLDPLNCSRRVPKSLILLKLSSKSALGPPAELVNFRPWPKPGPERALWELGKSLKGFWGAPERAWGPLGTLGGPSLESLGGHGKPNYIHKLPINRPGGRYVIQYDQYIGCIG